MIRSATVDDCKSVYSLICEMEECALDYSIFRKIYYNMIKCDAYAILVALEDDKIVGEITLRFEEQLHHCAKIAEIMECSVTSDFRSRGIGKQLFESACEVAKDRNCMQIEVSSNQIRMRAHKFYERMGMQNTHYKFSKSLL